MRTISIRLDDKSDAILRELCERQGLNQTDAVKMAIEQFARNARPTPDALARELGLIGSFESGVGDLGRRHSEHVKARLRAATLDRRKAAGKTRGG